jgi:hypothetical protein
VIPFCVRETFDYILLVYLLYRVMPCIKLLHFSFSDLQMMWPLMIDSWRKEAFELIWSQRLLKGLTREYFFAVHISAFSVSSLQRYRKWLFIVFDFSGSTASQVFVWDFIVRGRFRGSPAIINYQVPFLHTGEATRTPSSSFHAAPPGIRPSRLLRGAPHEQGRARRRWDLLSKSIGLHDEPILPG